jgi:hypothetical protein
MPRDLCAVSVERTHDTLQFIDALVGSSEKLERRLHSRTTQLSAIRFPGPKFNLVLVDVPGFDNTYRSDLENFQEISSWLKSTSVSSIWQIPLPTFCV